MLPGSFRLLHTLCGYGVHQQTLRLLPLRCTTAAGLIQVRGRKRKFDDGVADPYNYLKRKLRKAEAMKFQKKPLMSKERMQQKLNRGLPFFVTSLNQVISPIIPLERFAKAPLHTKLGTQQRGAAFRQNLAVMYAGGIIKRRLKKVDPFRPIEFGRKAQEQFIEVNLALQNKDKETLRELTTENAKEELMKEFLNKRFTWRFVEELERPRIISAHVAPFNTKDNLFAQVVVRIKSKQILAVYGPTGGVIKGDPDQPREVIDYVVFERHLVEPERTSWRILTKLPPQRPWRAVMEAEKKGEPEVAEEHRAIST